MEIIWTNHAAKRVIERKLDVADVLEAINYGLAHGLFGEQGGNVRTTKARVVAKIEHGKLVVITVSNPNTKSRRNLNGIRNHKHRLRRT